MRLHEHERLAYGHPLEPLSRDNNTWKLTVPQGQRIVRVDPNTDALMDMQSDTPLKDNLGRTLLFNESTRKVYMRENDDPVCHFVEYTTDGSPVNLREPSRNNALVFSARHATGEQTTGGYGRLETNNRIVFRDFDEDGHRRTRDVFFDSENRVVDVEPSGEVLLVQFRDTRYQEPEGSVIYNSYADEFTDEGGRVLEKTEGGYRFATVTPEGHVLAARVYTSNLRDGEQPIHYARSERGTRVVSRSNPGELNDPDFDLVKVGEGELELHQFRDPVQGFDRFCTSVLVTRDRPTHIRKLYERHRGTWAPAIHVATSPNGQNVRNDVFAGNGLQLYYYDRNGRGVPIDDNKLRNDPAARAHPNVPVGL